MIQIKSNAKIVFAILLILSVFISCKSDHHEVEQPEVIKEKIGYEVNGEFQLSVDKNFVARMENQLAKQGLEVELNDFALLNEDIYKDNMLFASTSKDGTVSTFFDVVQDNENSYYIVVTSNTTCVGDPGCNGGCFKVPRTVNGVVYWVCRPRCYNGIDCVTVAKVIGGNGSPYPQ